MHYRCQPKFNVNSQPSNVFARHKSLTAAFVKMDSEREAAEENACRVEHVISEDAFKSIKSTSE